MTIKNATLNDFDIAFSFIEKLWTYNTYDRQEIREVFKEVLSDENTFAFFLIDEGEYRGFCHGDFFHTFWMSGMTCYVSTLITEEIYRGKGYGRKMLDHVCTLAREKGCRAITLDSGLPRVAAHGFYEHYGFEKSCYGFELIL